MTLSHSSHIRSPLVSLLTALCLWLGHLSLAWASAVPSSSSTIQVAVNTSHAYLLRKEKQRIYLKIGLSGHRIFRKTKRAPLNLAIVLDRSTSMTGERLAKAKEAAKLAIELLHADDIVSLITYDSTIEVLVPATKLTPANRADMQRKIDAIYARGWTALWGGVKKGIEEVQKFLDAKRVNRVILLSDGQANVGPSRPQDMAKLAQMSAKAGIAITTVGLGLGYNEDIMTQLAQHSDGNHGFAKNASDLQRIFQSELGNLLAVVGQNLTLQIACGSGIRPIRILDRQANIRGQRIEITWNQLYSEQHKYIIVEAEVLSSYQEKQPVARVQLQYRNMQTQQLETNQYTTVVHWTTNPQQVQSHTNKTLMSQVTEATANEITQKAVKLRDQGKYKEAKALLLQNAKNLKAMGLALKSKRLLQFSTENESNAKNLDGYRWNETRKSMRKSQYLRSNQTTW